MPWYEVIGYLVAAAIGGGLGWSLRQNATIKLQQTQLAVRDQQIDDLNRAFAEYRRKTDAEIARLNDRIDHLIEDKANAERGWELCHMTPGCPLRKAVQ